MYTPADELAEDIHLFTRKQGHKVRPGRRNMGPSIPPPAPSTYYDGHTSRRDYREDFSTLGGDAFEYDVVRLLSL